VTSLTKAMLVQPASLPQISLQRSGCAHATYTPLAHTLPSFLGIFLVSPSSLSLNFFILMTQSRFTNPLFYFFFLFYFTVSPHASRNFLSPSLSLFAQYNFKKTWQKRITNGLKELPQKSRDCTPSKCQSHFDVILSRASHPEQLWFWNRMWCD
jgi:hypothetical protein